MCGLVQNVAIIIVKNYRIIIASVKLKENQIMININYLILVEVFVKKNKIVHILVHYIAIPDHVFNVKIKYLIYNAFVKKIHQQCLVQRAKM
jgi:hypothetical protein